MKNFMPEKPLSELSTEEIERLAAAFSDEFTKDFETYTRIGSAATKRDPFVAAILHFVLHLDNPRSIEAEKASIAFIGYYEKQLADLEKRINNLAALIAEKE